MPPPKVATLRRRTPDRMRCAPTNTPLRHMVPLRYTAGDGRRELGAHPDALRSRAAATLAIRDGAS